jgi:hypothetical protein
LMAPSRILDGSASGMGRSTECLCYSVDGEFCRKESLRQLFLKILVGSATMAVMINRVPLLLCWRRIRLKESLRQLFLVILVCLSIYGRVDQQSAFVTLLTENSLKESLRQLFLRILVCLWSADVVMCRCVCRNTSTLSPKFQSSNTCSNGRVHKLTQMVEFINPRKWQSPKTRSNGKVRNGTFTNCKGRSRPYFYLY